MRLSIDSLKHNEEQGEDLRFSPELTPSWLHAYGLDQDDRAVKVKEAILERIKTRTIFAAIGREDELRAVGLVLLDGEWGWINCMHTLRGYRRQGLGRQIIAGLCKRLCDLGASAIHLQVESDNVGARELYGSHGFEEIYRYHYRVGAQPDASKVIGV